MKKLILTLFAAAAVFVACDKDTYEDQVIPNVEEMSSIDDISQEEIDSIIGDILDNLANYGSGKLGNANTSGRGSDYVAIYIFSQGGIRYMAFVDETNDDLVFPSGVTVSTLYFDNGNGDGSALVVENADQVEQLRLNGNFASFFSGGNNELIQVSPRHRGTLDATNATTVNGVSFSFAAPSAARWIAGTADANGRIMVTHADLGSYRLDPAPFPLTGMLATLETKTGAAASRTVNNYAGTSSSAVMTEIENDFAGIE